MKVISVAVALIAGLAVTAAAEAAPRLSGVRSAAYAHPGGELVVQAAARRAPRVRFVLSADRRRSSDDIALVGVGRARGARRAVVRVATRVPAAAPLGAFRVLACARSRCAASKATVTLTSDPVSTADLIAREVSAGRLSPERGLVYRVFAAFGDRRLPARLAGDDGDLEGDSVPREVAAAWPTLSRRARRTLAPFMMRPTSRRSWAATRRRAARRALAAAGPADDPCDADFFDYGDHYTNMPAVGGKFRIWWARDREHDGELAASLAKDLGTAYERFKAIMGRDLLPDDGTTECYHGSDGAYDIYLAEHVAGALALTIPSAQSPKRNLICDGTPTFIIIWTGVGSHPTRWALAHELFHAFQYLFPYKADCRDYLWFDEGAANWGAHAAFPSDDEEHHWDDLLKYPRTTLNTMTYDSWPFPLYLERAGGGTQRIRRIYEEFGGAAALPAIDRAIGGFRSRWPELTRFGWNQPPLEPSFKAWDRLADVPLRSYRPIEPVRLALGGEPSRVVPVEAALGPLTRDYQLFGVVDEEIRELRFKNTLAGMPGAAVQAIVTLADGSQQVQDWTDRRDVTFCRDKAAERVTDVVLMLSNSNFDEDADVHPEPAPSFKLSNACDGPPYHYRTIGAGFSTRITGSFAGGMCAPVGGISSTTDFAGQAGGLPFDGVSKLARAGTALSGIVSAPVPAAWVHRLEGCTYNIADGTVSECKTTIERSPLPDGKWPIGFSIFAASPDASTARLGWSLPSPEVGFQAPGAPGCNVTTIMQRLAGVVTTREVPLERLTGTEPQTFTFEGSHHWDTDVFNRPAPIDYTWTYSITIQRVDAAGKPL